jgi:hypothetical protein
MKAKLMVGLLASAFTFVISTSSAAIPVDPRGAFLRTCSDSPAYSPLIVSLASLGLVAGDTIFIQRVGDWDNGPGGDDFTGLGAVFSSTSALLDPSNLDRITGAIDAGVDINTGFTNNCPDITTNIAQDFLVTDGATVVIPTGANYLFFAAVDSLYFDNTDIDNDFGVTIEKVTASVPEPGTLALLGLSLAGLAALRRRKQ